jgi:hypothetical protein
VQQCSTATELPFKRPNTEGTGTGHDTITDLYDHPDFPDGDGRTYLDLTKAAGLVTALDLASTVLRRLLGQRGELYEDITNYPKSAFLLAVFDLLDNHYALCCR